MIPINSQFTREPYGLVKTHDQTSVASEVERAATRSFVAVVGTELVSFTAPKYAEVSDSTMRTQQMGRPEESKSEGGEFGKATSAPDSPTDRLNAARLDLLARRYVNGGLGKEQEARLSIATQKIIRLIPAATSEDYEALGDVLERAAGIRSANAAVRARFRLE